MNKRKLFNKIFITSMMLALPATAIAVPFAYTSSQAQIQEGFHYENLTIPNSSFSSSSSSYSRNDLTGWKRIKADGSATTMIIDTDKDYSSNKNGIYFLSLDKDINSANPENDNKVLMINSALKKDEKDRFANEGYRSDPISLSENSYYFFEVSMKTASFSNASEFGSLYISGLKDKDDKDVVLSFEKQQARDWTKYFFFIETGSKAQNVTLDLWLGTENEKSRGVVFFDEVYAKKLSENEFYDELFNDFSDFDGVNYAQKSTVKFTSLKDNSNLIDSTGYNFDFEDGTNVLSHWNVVDQSFTPSTAHAQNLNLLAKNSFKEKIGKNCPGTNYSTKKDSEGKTIAKEYNTQALVLWTDEPSHIAVESESIDIKAHTYYKISMYVKSDLNSGSFTAKIQEQDDIFTNFPSLNEAYPIHSGESSKITSTSGNNFTNGYELVELYVEGNQLYNSKIKLQLCLGNKDNLANGYVAIDDIKIEKIAQSDYKESNNISLAYTTNSDLSIKNGLFNNVSSEEISSIFTKPADFKTTTQGDEFKSGIINTYEDYFNEFKSELGLDVANPAMLKNAPFKKTESNNVFAFYNPYNGYQSLQPSTALSVEKDKTYQLSFDVTTYTSPITISLLDEDGVVLYNNNVKTENEWKNFKISIKAGQSTSSITLIINFGTSEEKVQGFAFIDNLKFEENENEADENLDLTNFMLNLDPNGTVNSRITKHSAFNGSLTKGKVGEGGVIIGKGNTSYTDRNNNPIDQNTELNNNVLVINAGENSTYKLTSKFKLDVEEGKFYKLSFKLLTAGLPDLDSLPKTDENGKEIEYKYGVTIGLNGYDNVSCLSCESGWKEYSVIFKSESKESVNFIYSLVSDQEGLFATSFLTDISWSESDESAYSNAENKEEFGKTLFTAVKSNSTEESENTDEDSEATPTETNNNDINWLLIPSLIFGVAIVIAIIGAIFRKISSKKKPENKPKEKYDRKETLDKNVLKVEAIKLRDQEIKTIESSIESLEKDLSEIEKEHKEYINASRTKNNGKITKEIEKQFKIYGSKRSKIVDRINLLKEQLVSVKSPEYLLTLEKKVSKKNK